MKKFIQIGSTVDISVTPDLRSINATNPMSNNPNSFTVKSGWTRLSVDIKKGINWYPSEIKDWSSVQSLANEGILTVGLEADTCPKQEEVEAVAHRLKAAERRFDSDKESIETSVKNTTARSLDNMFANITKN